MGGQIKLLDRSFVIGDYKNRKLSKHPATTMQDKRRSNGIASTDRNANYIPEHDDEDEGLAPEVKVIVEKIREEGYYDYEGNWHPPWSPREEAYRRGVQAGSLSHLVPGSDGRLQAPVEIPGSTFITNHGGVHSPESS